MAVRKKSVLLLRWKKIKGPRKWDPNTRSSLIGQYVGTKEHQGMYGVYHAVYVATSAGVRYVSGSMLINLVNAATGLRPGDNVRVEFLGMKPGRTEGHEYKDFNFFVEAKVGEDALVAICDECGYEMTTGVSCVEKPVEIDGKLYDQIPVEDAASCAECAAPPGGYHHPGCENEVCPNCGGHTISCDCFLDEDNG